MFPDWPGHFQAVTEDHIREAERTGTLAPLRTWIWQLALTLGMVDPWTGSVINSSLHATLKSCLQIDCQRRWFHPSTEFPSAIEARLAPLKLHTLAPLARLLSANAASQRQLPRALDDQIRESEASSQNCSILLPE